MTVRRSRRAFLRAAVAAGGASALAACVDRTEASIPRGAADPDSLPERQFAWNDSLPRDEHGNAVLPRHHLLLYLDYAGDGAPDDDDRETLEAALRTVERAYERSNEGVVHSLAYSPAYFDRFDDPLPDSLDLPRPRRLSAFEDPTFDEQDALLHLASDRPDALLEAEEALRGRREEMNGVDAEATLAGVLEASDRRTGFVGAGLPAENQEGVSGIPDGDPVPEDAPLFMGFKAGFAGNQATEERVAIPEGPFAGGTTKHVSTLRQRLDKWFGENDHGSMVDRLFSPVHREEGSVDGVGENLGSHSGVTEEVYENVRSHAKRYGVVGHAEKAARANRGPDGEPLLLRRHFESTDEDAASLHFPTLQRGIGEFERVREAMNGGDLTDLPQIRQRVHNGILRYIFVRNRGNFLVPPRSIRAFPTPAGTDAGE